MNQTLLRAPRQSDVSDLSTAKPLRVAYLVNQYPKISHSWIWREIQAIEELGIEVDRYSIRAVDEPLVNEQDARERAMTRVILARGIFGLMLGALWAAATRPVRFVRAFWHAIAMGRCSSRGLLYHFVYFAEACVFLRWTQAREVQHVHAHFGTNSATVAALWHVLSGRPFSFTVHGPELAMLSPFGELQHKIELSRFLVAISHNGRSQLYRDAAPHNWAKMQLVHCGVDEMFLEEPPASFPSQRRLVCVARLSPEKGHLLLIEAAYVLAEEGHDFEIALVGDGEFRSQVEAHTRRFGLEKRITILGWLGSRAVRDEILRSQAMVLPSFDEGLPVVFMESLALGRPVISTYIAGIPELIQTEVNGWLVPAGSLDALVDALRAAITTPAANLQRMGQHGRERVLEQHDSRKEAAKLATLFRQSA